MSLEHELSNRILSDKHNIIMAEINLRAKNKPLSMDEAQSLIVEWVGPLELEALSIYLIEIKEDNPHLFSSEP